MEKVGLRAGNLFLDLIDAMVVMLIDNSNITRKEGGGESMAQFSLAWGFNGGESFQGLNFYLLATSGVLLGAKHWQILLLNFDSFGFKVPLEEGVIFKTCSTSGCKEQRWL